MRKKTIAFPSSELLRRLAPVTPAPGLDGIRAHCARDVFSLWQAWEEESGSPQEPPFWAAVWPGAILLSRYVCAHPATVFGKKVIDLGCGGGIAGVSAKLAGAVAVIANDIDPVALWCAERNAAVNNVSLTVTDDDCLTSDLLHHAEVILAADLFYEKRFSELLLQKLRHERRRGVQVYIADGGRPFAPNNGVSILAKDRIEVNTSLEGVRYRNVRLLRLD